MTDRIMKHNPLMLAEVMGAVDMTINHENIANQNPDERFTGIIMILFDRADDGENTDVTRVSNFVIDDSTIKILRQTVDELETRLEAANPPKIDSGTKATTASGHSVSMTYGPPEAQNPPRPITVALPM